MSYLESLCRYFMMEKVTGPLSLGLKHPAEVLVYDSS